MRKKFMFVCERLGQVAVHKKLAHCKSTIRLSPQIKTDGFSLVLDILLKHRPLFGAEIMPWTVA